MDSQQIEPKVQVKAPHRIEELGLPYTLLEDLVLRRVIHDSKVSMGTLAERMCLSTSVTDAVVRGLRERKLMDFDGLEGRDYVLVPTEAGRRISSERSQECRYAGPVPVSINDYRKLVHHQKPTELMDRNRLSSAFSDLVLSDTVLDAVGPAVVSEGAIFLYGPPGTGKTSIAERVVRAYGDCILVPHCVEADGQIIVVFDPTTHTPVEGDWSNIDPRYVVCKRPAVVTGGELQSSMLDLYYDSDVGIYSAPLQMKANNGVLVIDDFGRQAMSPAAMLNRWIVPLDRHVDYLTLAGRKVEVPFELKVVLSTNIDPAALGDDAFFRRIRNKIFIGSITDDQFDWILSRVTRKEGFGCDSAAALRLREQAKIRGDGELRAYLPSVVVEIAGAVAAFDNLAPILTPELVDRVLDLYFTKFEYYADVPASAPEPSTSSVQSSLSKGAPVSDPGAHTAQVENTQLNPLQSVVSEASAPVEPDMAQLATSSPATSYLDPADLVRRLLDG